MSAVEEIIKAALKAPSERQKEALRILEGQLPKSEKLLTLRALSKKLGFGQTSLRRWNIPSHDLGGIKRYKFSEVENYLGSQEFCRLQAALRAERHSSRKSKKSNEPSLQEEIEGRSL